MEIWTMEEDMLGKGSFATNMKWNLDALVLLGMIFWDLIVWVGMIFSKILIHIFIEKIIFDVQ
jgi:hypothetical protein